MSDLYRGYEIKPVTDGFVWTDESGNGRYEGQGNTIPYATADKAMDAIDKHKRAIAAAKA
jgi:hypothetical protein